MIIVSDVPEVDKAITSVLPTSIAIRYDRLMRSEAPAKIICPYADDVAKRAIWIDLPRGSRWRANELATHQTVLKDVVQHRSCQIVCVVPFLRGGLGYSLPHQRWKQILSIWKAAHHYGMQLRLWVD